MNISKQVQEMIFNTVFCKEMVNVWRDRDAYHNSNKTQYTYVLKDHMVPHKYATFYVNLNTFKEKY